MYTTLSVNSLPSFYRFLLKSALFCCFLSMPMLVMARHIIGGEMTYRFVEDLGNGLLRYEFTLVVYRDCDSGGGTLDNPASIGIYRGTALDATLYTDFNVNLQGPVSVSPVIPPCADASAVSNACVQRGVYVFTRDLPLNTVESYFVVYQRCCRTEQILNILNPGNSGATYMVELTPAAQAAQNSSPIFLNYPPTFICNNFKLDFDHSATDADGDSLVYSFCNPLDGGGQGGGPGGGNACDTPVPTPPCGPAFDLIPFAGVYTALAPMGGNPVIVVDTFSGHLTGTPKILGQFVVGICVKEYRNGVYLGMVLRDFQFNVVDCTPTVIANVAANANLGPKKFLVERCGDKIVSILNQSQQTADLISWEWEVDLKNGTIFSANTWHLTVALPDFGTYTARLYLNRFENCKDTAFITLNAFPGVKANYGYEWDLCTEGPVIFTDSSFSGASSGIVSRNWVMGTGDTLKTLDVNYQYSVYGQYVVKLQLVDSDGCTDEKIETLDWNPKLPPVIPNPGDLFACLPEPIRFINLDSLDLTDYKISWDFGDGSPLGTEKSPVHQYTKPGIYTASVVVTSPYDCFSTDTFVDQITVRPSPVANFNYQPSKLSNLENEAQFYDLSDTSVVQWNWLFGDNGRSFQQNPKYTFQQDTGLVPVTLRVTNQYGCSDTLVRILDIVPTLRLYLPNVFAPQSDNGNGNDRFGLLGIIPGYEDFNMKIWSRWGELLFESNRPEDQWNGRKSGSGKVYPPGVYIYQINMTGPRKEPIRLQGSVSLVD